jgi:hypothetical protein
VSFGECVYMYTCITHINMQISYTYTYIYIYIHVMYANPPLVKAAFSSPHPSRNKYTHTCMYTYIIHTCIHTYIHTHTYTYLTTHVCKAFLGQSDFLITSSEQVHVPLITHELVLPGTLILRL